MSVQEVQIICRQLETRVQHLTLWSISCQIFVDINIHYYQEPITRRLQLPHIPVTAF